MSDVENNDIKKAANQVDASAKDSEEEEQQTPEKANMLSPKARLSNRPSSGRPAPYSAPLKGGAHAKSGGLLPDDTAPLDETKIRDPKDEEQRNREKADREKDEEIETREEEQQDKKDSTAERERANERDKRTPPHNGPYEYVDKNSKRHIITYTNGEVTGPVRIFDSKNNLEFEGQMIKGKLCGTCRTYKDGVLQRISEMQNDVPHGLTKQFDETGALWIETTFVNGKKHGQMKQYNKSGAVTSLAMYESDNMHGPSESFDEAGDIESRTYYAAGKMHGTMEAFYSRFEGGGRKRLAHYSTGKLHGRETIYQSSGIILTEATYEHGKKVQAAQTSDKTKPTNRKSRGLFRSEKTE